MEEKGIVEAREKALAEHQEAVDAAKVDDSNTDVTRPLPVEVVPDNQFEVPQRHSHSHYDEDANDTVVEDADFDAEEREENA